MTVAWQLLASSAAAIDEAVTDVLACMAFPAALRIKLHATHSFARLNGVMKRCADVVWIFANEKTNYRLTGAVALEQMTPGGAADAAIYDRGSHAAPDNDLAISLPATAD